MSKEFDIQLSKLEDGSIDPNEAQQAPLTVLERECLVEAVAESVVCYRELDILNN